MRSPSWRSRMPMFMKQIYRHGVHRGVELSRFIRKMDDSQMQGRVFDLRRKCVVELEGFGLYIMQNDSIGCRIAEQRIWEPHVTRVLRRTLHEGSVFVDLGANLGYFSMLASSLVKDRGKVLAFEPNPQNLQLIYASILHNRFSNMTVYPYAVSDRSDILRFLTIGSNGGVITEHSANQNCCLLAQSVVLDKMLINEERIDVVKMDIEAHEPAALRGMQGLLQRHRPILITEFYPLALRCNNNEPPEKYLRQLQALDYCISVILPDGELARMHSCDDVMRYWAALGCETANLDLYAEPIGGRGTSPP